jgi:ribose transport system ATP-binding protein
MAPAVRGLPPLASRLPLGGPMTAPSGGNGAPARLDLRDVSKSFGRVKVLDAASLNVAPGEVHGLIGQNGSGKTTLIKLLSGFHTPDDAEFRVDGEVIPWPVDPRQLRACGLSFVHQDLGLVDSLSVVENARVGLFSQRRWSKRVDWDHERRLVRQTLDRLRSGIDPDTPVAALAAPDRAVVALVRALQSHRPGQGCIVIDEATRALPRETLPQFYEMVRDLSAEGASVVVVSHRLKEIMELTDRVTVLRDGRVAAAGVVTADTSVQELTRLLLGRDSEHAPLQPLIPTQAGTPATPALAARSLTGRYLRDCDLTLQAGEVVGVIGATESGYEELPYVLGGAARAASGEVTVAGRTLQAGADSLREFVSAGVALVPGDRASEGLALSVSVLENLSLPILGDHSAFWLSRKWQAAAFESVADELGIVPRRPEMPAGRLSGGNQQKVLLAKWLLRQPAVLVMHEPTQAVDVGARRDILTAIRRVAQRGSAVLVCSIEADDLAQVCDRVLIMADGRVASELTGELAAESILSAALSAHADRMVSHG